MLSLSRPGSAKLSGATPCCRGFLAAALSEEAKGVEYRRPWLTAMLQRVFSLVLGVGWVQRRLQQVKLPRPLMPKGWGGMQAGCSS